MTKITPQDRRKIIEATGICLNPDCVAHDSILVKILEYGKEAYRSGYKKGHEDTPVLGK